jgi:hypothetical protein
VAAAVSRLTGDDWQYAHAGADDAWVEVDEAGERKTAVVDGACVFLNRPGFDRGSGFARGAGCALHRMALAEGVQPLSVKPDVCWQLPIRRSYRTVERPDETSCLEVSIGEYDRRGWGSGGHDLSWYCTGSPAAHIGVEPVFRSLQAELLALIGEPAFRILAEACDQVLDRRLSLAVHPAGESR